jgi:ribosomal protein L11 methyltransferase (prmA)
MRVKQLESILGNVSSFQKPKINLEQYTTPAHIAANIVHSIASYHDYIEDKCLADLGTGPGILAIASSLIGFNYVLAVDVDKDALNDARTNINLSDENYDLGLIDLIQADLTNPNLFSKLKNKVFDVVVMNPPFGTKCKKGIDIAFLKTAFSLADDVYSLHKSSTREVAFFFTNPKYQQFLF